MTIGVAGLRHHLAYDRAEPGLVRRHRDDRVRGDIEYAAAIEPVRLAPGLDHAHALAADAADTEQSALEPVEVHDRRLGAGRGETERRFRVRVLPDQHDRKSALLA